MQLKLERIYKRSETRKKAKKFNNIIELIGILSQAYLLENTTLEIYSPFGGSINIGKFDNSGKRSLQLKLSSSGCPYGTHPGTSSKGDSWMLYETWVHYLDRIDHIKRDYLLSGPGFFPIKKASRIKNNDDFEQLIAQIDDLTDELEDNDDKKITSELKRLEDIAKEVKSIGTLRKRLAAILLRCLSWNPSENSISYDEVSEIPEILSKYVEEMQCKLKLEDELQPKQARAADSFFFIAVCENFRVPGAVKYMRSCLRYLIEENLTFQQVFHIDADETICTLSPKGGTKVTRNCLKHGDLSKISRKQRKPYETLSDSSDEENISTKKTGKY